MMPPKSRLGKRGAHGFSEAVQASFCTCLLISQKRLGRGQPKSREPAFRARSMACFGQGEGRHSNRLVGTMWASVQHWIIQPMLTVTLVQRNELGKCLDIPLGVNLDMLKETFPNCDFLRCILSSFFKLLRYVTRCKLVLEDLADESKFFSFLCFGGIHCTFIFPDVISSQLWCEDEVSWGLSPRDEVKSRTQGHRAALRVCVYTVQHAGI